MIIKTYDAETLQEKETISEIISVIFNRRFYKVGSFEIQTTSDKFETGDIIAYFYNGEIRSGIVMKIVENNRAFIKKSLKPSEREYQTTCRQSLTSWDTTSIRNTTSMN